MVVCVAVSACANQVQNKEDMLAASGFTVVPANTPQRQTSLTTLPPHKFVQQVRKNAVIYVYADPTICQCLYVGNQAAYDRYRANVFQKKLADEQAFTAQVNEMNWEAWGWLVKLITHVAWRGQHHAIFATNNAPDLARHDATIRRWARLHQHRHVKGRRSRTRRSSRRAGDGAYLPVCRRVPQRDHEAGISDSGVRRCRPGRVGQRHGLMYRSLFGGVAQCAAGADSGRRRCP
jgi:hypothetical protein